jgi:hypothetical protein
MLRTLSMVGNRHGCQKHCNQLCVVLIVFMMYCATAAAANGDISTFCSTVSLDAYGEQAKMVSEQGSAVQDQAEGGFNAVEFMQSLRGGEEDSGNSMTRIMKTHAWETKGLRYSQTLIFFAGPGIALGVIFFIFWSCMCGCRLCGK